jgi:hypothetical protein
LADLNEDGVIPTSELYTYFDQRAYAAAHLLGHTQRPQFWSLTAEQGEFVFIPDQRTTRQSHEPQQASPNESASEIARLHAELEKVTAKLKKQDDVPPSKPKAQAKPEPKAQPESKNVKSDSPSLEKSCQDGDGEKCFRLASRYLLGDSVRKDIRRGAGYFEKGCRSGDLNSCTALGTLFSLGEGVARDRSLARALWSYACKNRNQKACDLMSNAEQTAG